MKHITLFLIASLVLASFFITGCGDLTNARTISYTSAPATESPSTSAEVVIAAVAVTPYKNKCDCKTATVVGPYRTVINISCTGSPAGPMSTYCDCVGTCMTHLANQSQTAPGGDNQKYCEGFCAPKLPSCEAERDKCLKLPKGEQGYCLKNVDDMEAAGKCK